MEAVSERRGPKETVAGPGGVQTKESTVTLLSDGRRHRFQNTPSLAGRAWRPSVKML